MGKLTDIEGIGDDLSRRLKEYGIRSTAVLLREGSTRKGRYRIGEWCGIDENRVHSFVRQADLMRISGVGSDYAKMLEAAGVHSVGDLSRKDPIILSDTLLGVNFLNMLVQAIPSEKRVGGWVKQARTLQRLEGHEESPPA